MILKINQLLLKLTLILFIFYPFSYLSEQKHDKYPILLSQHDKDPIGDLSPIVPMFLLALKTYRK